MQMDPIVPTLAGVALAVVVIGLLLKRLGQPHVVGYIIGGVLLGPFGVGLIRDTQLLAALGAIGVLFLLFFVGMELPIHSLLANWRVAILGTLIQVLASVGCVWILGATLQWPVGRIVLLGFVISLSSTAVLLKLLAESGEMQTEVGRDVIGITLAQDLAVVPMLIVMGFLGGQQPSANVVIGQLLGAALIVLTLVHVLRRGRVTLPFAKLLRADHEMQVFAALGICFGLAYFTALLGLSTAMGAFVAGILVAASRQTDWIKHRLIPFHVVFLGLFFLSVGMLIDLRYLAQQWFTVAALVVAVLITNTFINAIVLRLLGLPWRRCLYAGAMLAQIGEFSFVLAAVGLKSGMISEYGYQATVSIIALTLLVSPAWIVLFRKMTGYQNDARATTSPAA